MKQPISQQVLPQYRCLTYDEAMPHIVQIYVGASTMLDNDSISSVSINVKSGQIISGNITYNKIKISSKDHPEPVLWPIQPRTVERHISECYELFQKFKPKDPL